MIQFLSLFAASDLIGTALDADHAMPMLIRIAALAIGVGIFIAVAKDRIAERHHAKI